MEIFNPIMDISYNILRELIHSEVEHAMNHTDRQPSDNVLLNIFTQYNHAIREYQTNIQNIFTGYNQSIREYQTNTRNIMSFYIQNQSLPTSSPPSSSQAPERENGRLGRNGRYSNSTQRTSSSLREMVYPTLSRFPRNAAHAPASRMTGSRNELYDLFPTLFQDVIVRPSRNQIENATRIIAYDAHDENNMNTSCPITMEDFEHGDLVCQIKHCRHLCSRQQLEHWFSQHSRCPICRYDIREYRDEDSVQDISSNTQLSNSVPTMMQRLTSALEDLIGEESYQTTTNNTDSTSQYRDIVYSIEIPLFIDSSYNEVD